MPIDKSFSSFSASLRDKEYVLKKCPLQSFIDLCRESQPRSTRIPKDDSDWELLQQCDYLKSFVDGSYEPPIVLIQQNRHELVLVADGQRRVKTLLAFVSGRVPWIDDCGRAWYFVEPIDSIDTTSEEPLKILRKSDRDSFLQTQIDYISIDINDDAEAENALYHIRYNHTLCPGFHWAQKDAWSERLSAILTGCPGLDDLLLWTGMNYIRSRDTFLICLLMSTKALRGESQDCERLLVTQYDCEQAIEELGDLQPVEKARLARMSKRLAKVGLAFAKSEHPDLCVPRDTLPPDATLHPIEIIAMALLVLSTLDSSEPEIVKQSTAMIREVRKKPGQLRLDQGTWNLYRKWFPSSSAIDLPKQVSSSANGQPAAAIATAGEDSLMIDIPEIIMSSDPAEMAPSEHRSLDPTPIMSTKPAQSPASAGTNRQVRTSVLVKPTGFRKKGVDWKRARLAAVNSPITTSSEAGHVATTSSTPVSATNEARLPANDHGCSATASPTSKSALTGGDVRQKVENTAMTLEERNSGGKEQAPNSSRRTSSGHISAFPSEKLADKNGQPYDRLKNALSTQEKPKTLAETLDSRASVGRDSRKMQDSDTTSTPTPDVSLSDRGPAKHRQQEALPSRNASTAATQNTSPAIKSPNTSATDQRPLSKLVKRGPRQPMNEAPSTMTDTAIPPADDDIEIVSSKQLTAEKRKDAGGDGPDADRPKKKKKKRDRSKPMESILAKWVE